MQGKINPLKELLKWFFGLSEHTLPALLLCIIEMFPTPQHIKENMESIKEELRQELHVFIFN